jgi:hypothetical protein
MLYGYLRLFTLATHLESEINTFLSNKSGLILKMQGWNELVRSLRKTNICLIYRSKHGDYAVVDA